MPFRKSVTEDGRQEGKGAFKKRNFNPGSGLSGKKDNVQDKKMTAPCGHFLHDAGNILIVSGLAEMCHDGILCRKKFFHIIFYSIDSRNAEIFHQDLCHIGA